MTENNLTLKHIEERSSIRAYKKEKLTGEEMEILKKAVLSAPTARNRQALRYLFVTDPDILARVDDRIFHYCDLEMRKSMEERQADSFFYGAPLAVFIIGKDSGWIDLDAGIAIQTLAIAAQSMGLSSVILGMPRLAFKEDDPDNCRQALGLKEDERFCIAISIGHAAMTKAPHTHNPDLVLEL
ncbi:MAG: nitroreductase family protein [Clostridiaceae bacterium]|nr:nitroreductase family protein [Clostridiaceae bacterium]